MTQDRLANLHLLPPNLVQSGSPDRRSDDDWSTSSLGSAKRTIARRDGVAVQIDSPLFWYEPRWVDLPPKFAGALAVAVANLDVVVSALTRDVCDENESCLLFHPLESDTDQTQTYYPRITPYRAERYGLVPEDFHETRIIDVRLSPVRDSSGRLAYGPAQMARWESLSDDDLISGGGYVPAITLPTDIQSLSQASIKLRQLRRLSPSAAVFVSIEAYRLEQQITAALQTEPDGIILRVSQPEIEGIQLAALVYHARQRMITNGVDDLPLWVVPGEITPRDVAKLIALGANAVAIDSWCNPLVEMTQQHLPMSRYDRSSSVDVSALASEHLWDEIDQVIGLTSSLTVGASTEQLLGSFHPRWAQACGASLLTP